VLNVPLTTPWQIGLLVVSIIGWVFGVRPARSAIKKVFTGASVPACVGLAILCGAYAVASKAVPALAFAAVGSLLVAIALERSDKI
jgi:hypothetical protein